MSGPTGTNVDALTAINITGPTGTDPLILALFPTAEVGNVEPPHIATMEELLASRDAVVLQEAADRITFAPLLNPTRDQYRPQLFQWAAAGFPDLYIVQIFAIKPPAICADGVTRDIAKYSEYCVGIHLGDVILRMKELMVGIQPSWSVSGDILRIHVSKC